MVQNLKENEMGTKLNYCIDCHTKLTNKNRSTLQPGIRCQHCWKLFSENVTKTLENMVKDMENKNDKKPTRRTELVEEFLNSDKSHLLILDENKSGEQQIPVIKIKNHKGFYSTDCPNCGKTKILGSELNSLFAVCNKCYRSFNLEK